MKGRAVPTAESLLYENDSAGEKRVMPAKVTQAKVTQAKNDLDDGGVETSPSARATDRQHRLRKLVELLAAGNTPDCVVQIDHSAEPTDKKEADRVDTTGSECHTKLN